jgi:hypothetical protein
MGVLDQVQRFLVHLRRPQPASLRSEPTQEQKDEITEAIRKQRFRGDMAGRLEYTDPS